MYKVITIFIAVALLLTIGCDKCDNQSEKNKEMLLASFEAMNNQQWDSLDLYFAEDFHRYSQATPDVVIESLDDMRRFVKEWYTSFPDAHMEVQKVVAENDLVAVWVTFAGTHKGQMGPFPPTGKRMESETFGIFRFENGKAKEAWVTWDNVAGFVQLGIMPPLVPDQPTDSL